MAAARALERARAAGAIGPFGTSAQRSLRDGAIIAGLAAGRQQKEVASEFGVSVRTVHNVVKDYRSKPSVLDQQPMEIVEDFARSMRERIARFEAMAFHHADANPNVAVAAQKGAQQTEERLVELLAALGKLPDNLELFRAEAVLRQIAGEMVGVMQKLVAGETTPEAAMDVFNRAIDGDSVDPRRLPPAAS